jgi:two-component system, response regulator YesN
MLKVLIIDDEPLIRKGLKTIIQWNDYGFIVCGEAVNGEDGLKKTVELKPDLIIVDMKMPGMNGLDMIRHLRNSDIICKVIILSGYSDFDYAQKALEYGVECYLLKPIDRVKLIEKVKQIYDSIIKDNSWYGFDKLDIVLQDKVEKIVDKLYMAIAINSMTIVNDLMEDVKCSFTNLNYTEVTTKIGYIYIYTAIMNKLLTYNESLKGLIDIEGNVLYEIFNKKNLQQLHGYIKYKFISISDELSKIKPANIMDKILDYIDKNCSEDIKLDALAQNFNYNSIYLGKIFKNHTGKYFNTYLDMVRMEKAKLLLKDGLKVYQVAEKVGYEDIRYFYIKFKKYAGIPPAAFKQTVM